MKLFAGTKTLYLWFTISVSFLLAIVSHWTINYTSYDQWLVVVGGHPYVKCLGRISIENVLSGMLLFIPSVIAISVAWLIKGVKKMLALVALLVLCSSCIGFSHNINSQETEGQRELFPWEDKEFDADSVSLVGLWFEPHGASHNIVFNQDSSFVYHTYSFSSPTTSKELIYTGKYRKEGIKISLSDEQGWKSVMYIRYNGTNYYLSDSIKTRGIYLVQGSE